MSEINITSSTLHPTRHDPDRKTPSTECDPLISRADTTPTPPLLRLFRANTGLLLVAISQIFSVSMSLTAKYLLSTTSISTFTIIFVRMAITALSSSVWLCLTGNPNPLLGPPDLKIRKLLVLRGVCGFGGLFTAYQSLKGLNVSETATIQFLAPSVTALLGWWVLGERLVWREVVAGGICLAGVGLVSRPSFLFTKDLSGVDELVVAKGGPGVRFIGLCWAFASVIFAAGAYITVRKIGKQAHAMHMMLYFCYLCLIACTIGTIIQRQSIVFIASWKEFGLIILIGMFGFTGQTLMTLGFQREKAGRATLATYLSLAYSLVLELMLFGTVPQWTSVLGGCVIVISAVWVVVTKEDDQAEDKEGGYRRVGMDEESGVAASPGPAMLAGPGRAR